MRGARAKFLRRMAGFIPIAPGQDFSYRYLGGTRVSGGRHRMYQQLKRRYRQGYTHFAYPDAAAHP